MNFGSFQFGRSNQSQTGPMATPAPTQAPMNTSANQLDLKNNNQQPNPPGSGGEPGVNGNNPDPTKGTQGSHLEGFKDIFKVATDDKGQPIAHEDPTAQPLLAIDPQKLAEAAGKINFLAGVSQEDMQKAMSGQDPAAFQKVLQTGIQTAFTAAVSTTTRAAEAAIRTHQQRVDSQFDSRVRNVQIHQATPKNPALNHPAAQPIVAAMKEQIAQKNPHLSPDRVTEVAENYFIALSEDMQAGKSPAVNSGKSKDSNERDWSSFLN